MSKTDQEKPTDEKSEADRQAIDLLFKRIAKRGHRIRRRQQSVKEQHAIELNDQSDPIVEILRQAYRRGRAILSEQNENATPLEENKKILARLEVVGDTMNEKDTPERIDWLVEALNSLEKAIAQNDSRVIELELQTIRLELGNLRQMIVKANQPDD